MPNFKNIEAWNADGAAWIRICRPPMNVLDIPTIQELNSALRTVKANEHAVRALVITGKGDKAFSAGVDVSDHSPGNVNTMLEIFHEFFLCLDALDIPCIAAVKGAALGGGCEVALCCDLVVAADNAKLGQPEVKVGVFATLATVILPRLIPSKRAFELLVSGDLISAKEAHALGIVNSVVPLGSFDEGLQGFLRRVTGLSSPVLRTMKRALRKSRELPLHEGVKEVEHVYLNELMRTKDAQEGLRAFLEKRAPVWANE